MLSILCVSLTIKVTVGIPESSKVGWYPPPPQKKTGSSHLKHTDFVLIANDTCLWIASDWGLPSNSQCSKSKSKCYICSSFLSTALSTVCGVLDRLSE